MNILAYDSSQPLLFSSGLFWCLFLVFMPVFALLRSRRTAMMTFVALFSLYFYYKCSGWFVGFLLASSVVDWWIGNRISKTESKRQRRVLLLISITLSLSVLGFFKYGNFFLWNFQAIIGGNFVLYLPDDKLCGGRL